MEVQSPVTPRKVYFKSNICVVCGFNFIQKEITSTGIEIEKKFTNRKIKLTLERVAVIIQVISNFEAEHGQNGICTKCYGQVERVLRMQKDIEKSQKELNETRGGVRRSYNLTCSKSKSQTKREQYEKRLLQSPISDRSQKRARSDFPTNVSVVSMVTLPSFKELVSDMPTESTIAEVLHPKTARRSLPFTAQSESQGQETLETSLSGEVEVHEIF